MSNIVELMESRRLLSASLSTLISEAGAVESGDKNLGSEYTALTKTIAADDKAIQKVEGKASASDKSLLHTLTGDEKTGKGALKKIVGSTTSVLKRDGLPIVAVLKGLSKKPGNAALESKLVADANKLKADTSTQQAILNADATNLNTVASTDLTAISTANASTSGAVATAKSDVSTGTGGLQSEVTTLFSDLTQFENDATS